MTQEVIGGTTYNYTYDTYGNIRSKTTTSATTANFTYGTSGWLDKLLSYNGNSLSYDDIGNPTVWHDGSAFTWTNGKQLTAATAADGTVLSYSYNADGLRLTKVFNGVTHNYLWQGNRLVSEQYGTTEIEFFYDESGVPYALDYNGTIYYYITNLQGDVIGIVDTSGTIKAKYKYNAWGEDIDTTAAVSNIETINPLRYRGYYYDSETKLYYLQSRYYDPIHNKSSFRLKAAFVMST